ncbi:hypothetical protein CNECB9_5080006 [Cupriavidus necator]|uniref:Uncharacterized protein n=1 Tax=Cupriavidus necator TaxID=106590 RepID=A0A1K0J0D3_CUPNE|nr:hypothetical protein CNECB9_5080006 [Cupriavidus necator]
MDSKRLSLRGTDAFATSVIIRVTVVRGTVGGNYVVRQTNERHLRLAVDNPHLFIVRIANVFFRARDGGRRRLKR